jgi:chromosome segregation ATPase
MRSSEMWRSLVLLAVLCICGAPVLAAEARRDGDVTARLQMMLQQMNAEKTQLAAENAKLKAERDELKKAAESNQTAATNERTKLARTAQDLANAQANRVSLQQSFDTLKSRFEKVVEQYKKTVAVLREVEADRNELRTMASDYDVRVTQCERNNETLFAKNLELIDLYEHKGVLAALKAHEPVTGFKRVEMENLMEEYRYQAEEMRLKHQSASDRTAVTPNEATDAADGS